MKEINVAELTLKPEEIEILKRLGFSLVTKKKTPHAAPCNPKIVKPYTLEMQITCTLCGEKFSLYYKMESLTRFCLKSNPVSKPEGKIDKVEARKWKRCGNCSSNLEKLPKQEIISKLLWLNRGL